MHYSKIYFFETLNPKPVFFSIGLLGAILFFCQNAFQHLHVKNFGDISVTLGMSYYSRGGLKLLAFQNIWLMSVTLDTFYFFKSWS